jgi:type VI secretion system VgrG family protein
MSSAPQPRTLAVKSGPLASQDFTPIRLHGQEKLGELFEYTLELETLSSHVPGSVITTHLDLDALIGTELTVSIELAGKGGGPGGLREITGLICDAHLFGQDTHSVAYGVTLRPWLWLAKRNRDCRLFQDMTVVEITDAVLASYAFSVDKRLIEAYPKRDIQRQHWESDFAFLNRLWQEWGIYFWFDHTGGKHRLVLCDSIGAHRPQEDPYRTLRYLTTAEGHTDDEHIDKLALHHALTAGKIATVDYDYTRPRANLQAQHADPRPTQFANQELYAWTDHSQPQAGPSGLSGESNRPQEEAAHLARIRMQAQRAAGLRATGHGSLRGLAVGHTFTLKDFPKETANCEYLVVSSELEIQNPGTASGRQRYDCHCHFEIQPTNEPFRLPRTASRPRTSGPEIALVVGPAGQTVWTDAYGRIKAQFPWDRNGKHDQHSSCWLRVASHWQGKEFGSLSLPRVGEEVLIDHLNGDPDLPIVIGRVVNAHQQPAWKLPDNQTLSGLRSREFKGSRSNHVVLDDTEGKIQAQLSSDHELSQLNLGYLKRIATTEGLKDDRGEGFELRTDAHGVVRAAKGMLITTEARSKARRHAKDLGETAERLSRAQKRHDGLAEAALQHAAQEGDNSQRDVAQAIDTQNAAIRGTGAASEGSFPELDAPHLALASPEGIALTSAGTAHVASEKHVAVTAANHVSIAAGHSLLASVKNRFCLFVHKLGIKLVAASGKVRIEAQDDNIELVAQRVVEIISNTDWINLKAKQGIRLNGGGSQLEISAAGIVGHTGCVFQMHAADPQLLPPEARPVEFAPLASSDASANVPYLL